MAHLQAMAWDFKDQLQRVALGGGGTAYYVHDAAGQRTRKVVESQNGARQKERLYLGGFEIYREFGGNGSDIVLERESLHVMDDKRRIALVESEIIENGIRINVIDPTQRYQLDNHLASASVELDRNASVISYEEYHPHGTTSFQAGRSLAEVSLKRYRYTSKERDEETGFSYHGMRYCAVHIGRWVSADPLSIIDDVNLYAYTHCNPITNYDPSGAFTKSTYDQFLDRQIGSLTTSVEKQTQKLEADNKSKEKLEDRLGEIDTEKATLQDQRKAVAAKRAPLEHKKTKLTKAERDLLKQLKSENTKIVNKLTKLAQEKATTENKLSRLIGTISREETSLAKTKTALADMKDLKQRFDKAYATATATNDAKDVGLLTDVVMNEARNENSAAKGAIAYAYTHDTAHHMKSGHVAMPPTKGAGSISHFSAKVTEQRFNAAGGGKAKYINQIIDSLDVVGKRLTDTTDAHDPTQGATNWVSPGAPGMKKKFPPDGLPGWAASMTKITVPGVSPDSFTFLK
jgi:RHS repeat-associated protein